MRKSKKVLGILAVIPLLCLMLTGCVPGTVVEITSPEDGAIVTESPITVLGKVSYPARGEVRVSEGETVRVTPEVTVNGVEAEVAQDGTFSAQIELAEGENVIEAVAMLGELEARDSITVTYTPAVPALSLKITSPEDGAELTESPVMVSGTVSDPEATVAVNAIEAKVAEDGSFSVQVELTEGENAITAIAKLNEQEASDSIIVIYAPEAVPTGSVEVRVTDPEADSAITSANITASAVEIHRAGDGDEGEWIPLNIIMPTFDLIELKEEGLEEILASGNVTAGNYTQIRMTIEKVEVSIGEGAPQEATLPSGELKFVRPFEVSEGETTVLTLDFDAEKSVTITGAVEIIFKPTVKLTITPAPLLSVEITLPEDGAELTESPVTVTGVVSDAAAAVTVNGVEAEVAEDGSFSAQVELSEGENTIEVVAVLGEQEARYSITVTYSPAAPALSLETTSPEDGAELTESPVTVTGIVSDAAAAVTVNGVEAEVAEDGSFSAQVELSEGENTIMAIATLGEQEASDSIIVTCSPEA